MSSKEQLLKKQEEPRKPIQSREEMKRQMDVDLRKRAEKMKPELKKKFSANSIREFIKSHNAEEYKNYREWNEDFCRSVLGLEKTLDQRVRITALQLFLHDEVGGFDINKSRGSDSIDGKLGRFTLGKIEEYLKELSPPAKKLETQKTAEIPKDYKEVAPGVLSKLPEGQRFDSKNIYITGDSIMHGITAGRGIKKSNRRAVKSSRLVMPVKPGSRWYKWYKEKKKLIFVEEEAMNFIKNCEKNKIKNALLVLNGGVNDLYGGIKGKTTGEIAEMITKTYTKIINAAHAEGIKVAIYTLNKRFLPKKRETARVRRLNEATDKINQWLISKSGADIIYNTDTIAKGRVSERDGLHMKWSANKDLYAALDKIKKIG